MVCEIPFKTNSFSQSHKTITIRFRNANSNDGILLWAAKVEIENDKCNIISTKNYQYSLEELKMAQEEFDINYSHVAFCIGIRKDKDIEIILLGDFKSDFAPLFYPLDKLIF